MTQLDLSANTDSTKHIDELFQKAEQLSADFSLFPEYEDNAVDHSVKGLIAPEDCKLELDRLKSLNIDNYIEQVVAPSEGSQRIGAKAIVQHIALRIISELEDGPLYCAEAEVDFGGHARRIGFICQNREFNNGTWGAQHHNKAAQQARVFASRSMPIVTFIDTPGADASEQANANNQAHSISHLITEMANNDVPTLGIIWGAGYSGGAIPLATTNILLSVRDGIFNTIQPQGLASIARKYNLSWQECAKYVGVSCFQLRESGIIDGIIDYAPTDADEKRVNLLKAITTGIESIENSAKDFARTNPDLMLHYQRSVERFLTPSEKLLTLQKGSNFFLAQSPTEHINIFGLTYRYTRYLTLRRRIHSTTLENYGRLAEKEIPEGQLQKRLQRETKRKFQNWLQAPEKIVYDDDLHKSWKNFWAKYEDREGSRSTIARLFLGEPKNNYLKAKQDLCFNLGLYLFNRWKSDATVNFQGLMNYLEDYKQSRFLLRANDILDAVAVAEFLEHNPHPLATYIREQLPHETRQELTEGLTKEKSKGALRQSLATALNTILKDELLPEDIRASLKLSTRTEALSNSVASMKVEANRRILEEALAPYIQFRQENIQNPAHPDITILDAILHDELRYEFSQVCQNMLVFGRLYDNFIHNLGSVAKEANENRSLSREAVKALLEKSLSEATAGDTYTAAERESFNHWLSYFIKSSQRGDFLKSVEEWKKLAFPRLSDTLFVVITFIFEKLLSEYHSAELDGKNYNGRINPVSIGRRKDFWNRLTMAYHDLLIQEVLDDAKRQKKTSASALIERFFSDFEELNANLMSADPVAFPGFRNSIEDALKKGIKPCGVITGLGTIKVGGREQRVGALISNLEFQAGAFDMASAEKFCKLMVECARQHLPLVCFVSSGGMQTKEGAAALFSMAVVNDRLTRFVRDNDLPIVIFGFGDCTGGAQASFVTHPLAQTYYFSGTNMPFAGQIVVPSYLPSTCTLSNYLSVSSKSMDGLVAHPFLPELDERLRAIDPDMPVARYTVDDVLARVLEGYVTAERMAPDTGSNASKLKKYGEINKVLIHARGCTAVKLIRKAQENDIKVVLIQSDPDMESVPVDMLGPQDRVVCIGGNTPDESYLNAKSVLRIAHHEGVDALHPGIGFLSESSQFAALCGNHDINFVGPPVSSMETMGNKSNAINTAMRVNVPVVPGSHGILTSSANAASVADDIGYPVLLKAVHGGGGKGIQVVLSPDNIHSLFHQISTEAKAAFGNGDVYLEKYVTSLRHIEVQVLRDKHGNTRILGLRDCSVQRNNQKIFEESGSTMLPRELEQSAYDFAEKLADAVKYVGAGTVEFIFDLDSMAIYFMEMNTRLQVEHPVTELVSGIDIVTTQFKIAEGGSIEDMSPKANGYAIEVRVNAEKAVRKGDNVEFVPTPGTIRECVMPACDHIELISMAAPGKKVSPFYDSMVAQIICYGTDRNDTIKKLRTYLEQVRITGVCTNIPLLKRVLDDEVFCNGVYDTTYLPQFLDRIDVDALILDIEESADMNADAVDASQLKIEGSDELKVLSPSTSIFYGSSSPSEPAFVKEGDIIGVDQTLCLMEAMKMFTPLSLKQFNRTGAELYPANQKFKVTRIMNSDGQQVNQGDLLFVVKPIASAENAA
ncbi:biotin carboxylase N-terminal domain-containing protein [Thalassolituus oleivorans]|uniref:Acetyl-CoA carboxylase multifunctional enzyme accADC, carboxyl transferase subunit alpha/carboxyl transferase subunit n=1 Tax=Thalassolituus oleivorans MIL-1 TaxID=1298593 RepID=M5DPP0_9GAMM|nr:biotin carboxylase N-terminal domain-containing protein [Thalassolituus oleivorans]CCU71900.1 acetyl-CoA carboxylase multifunctional enzyme accADC, carboxyl transferase subunit alpha/carboxyl transferase subunit [Thalassolituus oleivorans MIL-1]